MPRILIVDDEQGIRSLLKLVFTKSGYEVITAADGREALERCECEPFDALLSDVRMPGMSGHELVRSVVVRHPEMRFVLMSGFDDLACVQCGQAPQRCALLSKPFRPSAAVEAVGQALKE